MYNRSHICSLGWLVGCISDMLKGDCVMQLWAMLSVVISLCSCVMQLDSKTHISPLLATESAVAQWLENPNTSEGRGFKSHLGLGFLRVLSGFHQQCHFIYISFSHLLSWIIIISSIIIILNVENARLFETTLKKAWINFSSYYFPVSSLQWRFQKELYKLFFNYLWIQEKLERQSKTPSYLNCNLASFYSPFF